MDRANLRKRILTIDSNNFDRLALDLFRFQYTHNPVYGQYCRLLGVRPGDVNNISQVPFLPVSIFRHRSVLCNALKPEIVFESSTTSGLTPSRHFIHELALYHRVSERCFDGFAGNPSGYVWLGLLPSYLERERASLVSMVQHFMHLSGHPLNGFFLRDFDRLHEHLAQCEAEGLSTILIGVSFALLDFASMANLQLRFTRVVETGGMKGQRREMTRMELHNILVQAFGVRAVVSEYGMTEMLSQAWSASDGLFSPGPTMRAYVRDLSDPLTLLGTGKRGALNVIDLGNLDSCAFLATDDVGVIHADGTFEVLGRIDASDLRGCNLMVGAGR